MIDAVVYSPSGAEQYPGDDLAAARDARGTTWVRASDASGAEMAAVADAFGIHPLSVEDVRGDVRPKTQEFDGYTFALVKRATFRTGETTFEEEVRTVPAGVFVGRDWLVTLSAGAVPPVEHVWAALERGDGRLLRAGPDFAAYRVVDGVVDDYFHLLDAVEAGIEDGLLDDPDPNVLAALNGVRRDLLSLRTLLWPTREATGVLARGDPKEVRESTSPRRTATWRGVPATCTSTPSRRTPTR